MRSGWGEGLACGKSSPRRGPRAAAVTAVRTQKTAERAAHDEKRVTPHRRGSGKNRRSGACGVTDYGFVEIGVQWTWSPAAVVFFANDRCNQENLIEQLKNG